MELLDPDSLGILAEATGVASRDDAGRFFAERPNGIRLALGSPEAAALLGPTLRDRTPRHRLLTTAIAVHRTAEEICSAGWTARDESPVDLPLLRFAGQGPYQSFMVELITSNLPSDLAIPGLETTVTQPGGPERLDELLELCMASDEIERAGAIRLLGDEALFTAGMLPAGAAATSLTDDTIRRLEQVLPRAVRSLLDELTPTLHTQLEAYLQFGPIWYRMAAQNLLHRSMRVMLGDMSQEFATARRFLVRVSQGPLAPLCNELFSPATS